MFNYSTLEPSKLIYIPVAPVEALPVGERIFIELDGSAIVIFNLAGKLFAIGDVCTHDNGPLGDGEVDQFEVVCPRHGARFDIRTGKTLGLPAVTDIPEYPVRVAENMIEIGIKK